MEGEVWDFCTECFDDYEYTPFGYPPNAGWETLELLCIIGNERWLYVDQSSFTFCNANANLHISAIFTQSNKKETRI